MGKLQLLLKLRSALMKNLKNIRHCIDESSQSDSVVVNQKSQFYSMAFIKHTTAVCKGFFSSVRSSHDGRMIEIYGGIVEMK